MLWTVILIVCVAGAIGGAVNALMTENGFMTPKKENGIWKAGIVGNIVVSAIAGLIAWGSSVPTTNIVLCTITNCVGKPPGENEALLTMGSLMTVVLVGIAGARWLTSEIDKKIMKKEIEALRK